MTDFRALCAELVDQALYLGSLPYEEDPDVELMDRASAALAEPEPEGPTPQPMPVSERLPGPGDCDEQGRCWFGAPDRPGAVACWDLECEPATDDTHWLPAHALPLPANTSRSNFDD